MGGAARGARRRGERLGAGACRLLVRVLRSGLGVASGGGVVNRVGEVDGDRVAGGVRGGGDPAAVAVRVVRAAEEAVR